MSIIQLYETLYQMQVERKGKKGAVELSYRQSSEELNALHLTFNNVARTINLAYSTMNVKMTEGKQSQALLSYGDAYHIYKEFDENHSQIGVCLANIGSIMFQKGDFKTARQYYEAAIKNLRRNMPDDHFDQADSLKMTAYALDLA